jgi:CheY-like chemotaxis protein
MFAESIGRKPRILIAEDDSDLLAMIALALEGRGAEVRRAHTGAELLLAFAHHGPIDVVITDVYMPWMNGLQALRSLQSAGLMPPAVVITGASDERLVRQIAALGPRARLLTKPVDLNELESAIDELLEW